MKTTIYTGKKNTKGHSKIKLELKEKEKGLCFSASGSYNYQPVLHTGEIYWDYESAGQCLEDIAKDNPQNKDVQVNMVHLNGLVMNCQKWVYYTIIPVQVINMVQLGCTMKYLARI